MKIKVILLSLLISSAVFVKAADQPNFLFLLSDDQHWTGLSCQMHPDIPESGSDYFETPALANLASQGMRFSAAYSPASVCSPTRISLQTGKSPAQMRWTKAAPTMTAADGYKLISPTISKRISTNETTIAELLKSAGYATAHYGKWHLGRDTPENHGYDESDGPTGNNDAAPFVEPNPVDIFGMGDRAKAFMQNSKSDGKPFFIQMSYHALHYPGNATKSLVEKYRAKNSSNGAEVAAITEDLDRGIGELIAEIDKQGIANNTYIIFMADNGGNGGRGRNMLRGGKGGVWEGGIRVPMIVRGPGVPANSWCHQRVVGYDWYNTFCELGGVKQSLPAGIEGGSIAHILKGSSSPIKRPRPELVFHFPHYQYDTPHTALLLGDYKLFRFYEDNSHQLYNLKTDISETTNLASQKPELVQQLSTMMDSYLDQIGAQIPTPNPQYDPTKPPPTGKSGGKGKGGKGKGKGKGGKGKAKRRPQ